MGNTRCYLTNHNGNVRIPKDHLTFKLKRVLKNYLF